MENAKLGCALAMVLGSAFLVASSNSDASEAEIVRSVAGKGLKREQCDLFAGEWIRNPSGPAYTNASCSRLIEPTRDCLTNGRPDTGYLYWRWKPFGCEVPQLDAGKFLDLMRNKAWAFIGDSLLENQSGSLICLLSKVEEAVQIYKKEFAFTVWYFPSYNFTVTNIWTPVLLKTDHEGTDQATLHLDTLDTKWTNNFHKYDYMVISGGMWFLRTATFMENNAAVGCRNCAAAGQNLTEYLGDFPYRKALRLAFSFMLDSNHKPLVLFRTWNMDHYEFGSNGLLVCNRTVPYRVGEYGGRATDHLMLGVEVEEFRRAAATNRARIQLLDTFRVSVLRPDGHLGLYWMVDRDPSNMAMKDCVHWCLPGVVDTWNDLAMEILMNEAEFRYSS